MFFWHQTKVFVSYRRDDSALHVRSLHADLATEFGRAHVFLDVDEIHYGDTFATIIDKRINDSDAVVVLIGPQWMTLRGADGQPRIASRGDHVRHEIATALRLRKRVVPVLVGGAGLPDRAELPEDIAGLLDLNALTFGDRQLGEGAELLIRALRGLGPDREPRDLPSLLRRIAVAAALAMFFAAWIGLFDFFGLDTKTASLTLWLADVVAPVSASNDIQVIAIDPKTEKALGKPFSRNPSARRNHAELIRKLAQAGARTVAFDIFITTPSPADDAVLVAAILQARALKTAVVFGAEDVDAGVPVMLPALRQAVSGAAMVCYGERLGYASTAPLASQRTAAGRNSDVQAEAVGLALATAYPGGAKIAEGARKVIVSGDSGIREFAYSETELIREAQPCKAGSVGDTVATAVYRAAPLADLNDPDRRIAYETVLSMSTAALRKRFQGRSALVGLVMPGDDLFETFHGLSTEVRHGLELHADAAGALLDNRVVQPLGLAAQFAAMTALGLFGSRLPRWLPTTPRWLGAATLFVTAAICIGVAVAMCIAARRLVNLTYPLAALIAGYGFARRLLRAR